MKHFEFTDYMLLKPVEVLTNAKRFFETKDAESNTGHSIVALINATHSGLITGNSGLYLPDKMRKGIESFTYPYKKPWLWSHDDEKPPIGRVLRASYVSLLDKWVGDKNVTALDSGTLSRAQEVAAIRRLMPQLMDKDNPGMGYAQLLVKITDPGAIAAVLDGRYQSVSTRQSSDSAACSLCGQEWSNPKNDCEHFPGQKDSKGNRCFAITGNLTYREGSFVNIPADQWAQIIRVVDDADETLDQITVMSEDEIENRSIDLDLFKINSDHKLDLIGSSDNLRSKVSVYEYADYIASEEKIETEDNTGKPNNDGGNSMKDLKKILENFEDLLAEVNKFLPAQSKLTLSDLVRRPDSDFCSERLLPVYNDEVANGVREFLAQFTNDPKAAELADEISKIVKGRQRAALVGNLEDQELCDLYTELRTLINGRESIKDKPWADSDAIKAELETVKDELETAKANFNTLTESVANEANASKDRVKTILLKLNELNETPLEQEEADKLDENQILEQIDTLLNAKSEPDKKEPLVDPTLKEQENTRLDSISEKYFKILDTKGETKAQEFLRWQKVPINFKPTRKK